MLAVRILSFVCLADDTQGIISPAG
jgi:hypothetical protein